MTVLFHRDVIEYLGKLAYQLYLKEYFGFPEAAKDYVSRLINDIETSIYLRPQKNAPPRFKQFGTHYAIYRTTKRTTWYVFFIKDNNTYYINYITNNHVSAQHIRGL